MEKKSVKINFVDFWPTFAKNDNFFTKALSPYFNLELSDDPDYIFYSVHGYDHLNYNCTRIFFTGENQVPDFNIADYGLGFQNINFEDRFLRYPLYFMYDNCLIKALKKHEFSPSDLKNKKRFCDFIYSNADAHPDRDQFFKQLSEYKEVASGGRHMNNIGGPVDDKYEFQKYSKFSIAFENTSANGYVTEKILQAFSAKTIPIYWGDPKAKHEFNENAFINCHDFPSFEAVIEHVKKVDQDDELYLQYINEPIFAQGEKYAEQMNDNFISFFRQIFESDRPSTAIRRNLYYWGKNYEKNLREMSSNTSKKSPSILGRVINKLR